MTDLDSDIYRDQQATVKIRKAIWGTSLGGFISCLGVGGTVWLLLRQPDTALVSVFVSQGVRAAWLFWKARRSRFDLDLLEYQLELEDKLL